MTRTPRSAAQRAWRALAATLDAWRQRSRLREELAALDDRTLRDLGIDRSEWQSVLAESSGDAEATRRRIAPRPRSAEPGRVVLATWVPRPLRMRWTSAAAALLAAVSLGGCSGSPGAALAETVVQRPVPAAAAEAGAAEAGAADAVYLPSQFPPPAGPIEPLPAQF